MRAGWGFSHSINATNPSTNQPFSFTDKIGRSLADRKPDRPPFHRPADNHSEKSGLFQGASGGSGRSPDAKKYKFNAVCAERG